jgi:hypothetical protein
VASIPIPVLGTGQTTHFRFVMAADPGAAFEGIAVDDIHIYDFVNPIAPANGTTTVTKDLNKDNGWSPYLLDNKLLAAVYPSAQYLPNTTVTLYTHDTLSNPTATQYTMPRSYVVKTQTAPTGLTGLRLYLLDSDVISVVNDTTCPSCTKLADAYSLGITQYDNVQAPALENGTLADDTGGRFVYYPYRSLQWVPYDKGYYAEFDAQPFSEFWFNNGGPTGNFSAGSDYLNFLAYRSGSNVSTYWYSLIDTVTDRYSLQRSDDGRKFITISDTPSRHLNPGEYSYSDSVNFTADSMLYYRLRWTLAGKSNYYYSPVRKITGADSGASLVTMNVTMIDHQDVLVTLKSYIDPVVNYYKVERAIGDGPYLNIRNPFAMHIYGSRYVITDDPGDGIKSGTLIHYRVTVILKDGNRIVLPVYSVEWIENNSVENIYPNPTFDGGLTIKWHADMGVNMRITISDVTGREMQEASYTATQWDNSSTLQTSNFAKGVYLLHIIIGNKVHAAKIVFY